MADSDIIVSLHLFILFISMSEAPSPKMAVPRNKLMCFAYIGYFKEQKPQAFNWDTLCHLALYFTGAGETTTQHNKVTNI
jgi:hypothetical protein